MILSSYEDVPQCSSWSSSKRQMQDMENSLDTTRDSMHSYDFFVNSSGRRDSIIEMGTSSGYYGTERQTSKAAEFLKMMDNTAKKWVKKNSQNSTSRAPNTSPLTRRNNRRSDPFPNRTRHLSGASTRASARSTSSRISNRSTNSRSLPRFLQLQVPSLTQDTARRISNYFSRSKDGNNDTIARVHQAPQTSTEFPVTPIPRRAFRDSTGSSQIEYDDTTMKIETEVSEA